MTDGGIMHQLSENFGLVFYPSMCIFLVCILLTNTNQPGLVEDAVSVLRSLQAPIQETQWTWDGREAVPTKATSCVLAPCVITMSGGQGSWSFMLPRSTTESSTERSNAHRVNNCFCCNPPCLL